VGTKYGQKSGTLLKRPGAYPRVEHLEGSSLGWAHALPANIRLRWEGLPRTNTLGYFENSQITAVKSFIECVQNDLSTFVDEM
jgi:hypothetical protein